MLAAVPQRDHRTDDLRDDIAGLSQDHRVADQHALALDLALVVQRRHLHGGSRDLHRLHYRVRRDPTGTPDVDADVEQLRVDLFGRVLEGDGPAGRPTGCAEPPLHPEAVDLDHPTVDLVLDRMPVLGVVVDERPYGSQIRLHLGASRGWQPPITQPVVPAGLAKHLRTAFDPPDTVYDHAQRPGGGHPGVFL